MSLNALLLILLAVSGNTPDPGALIAALGSSSRAEREEAAGALEELGRAALPALVRARDSADPQVRDRVAFLIDLIERRRLLRGTRVTLNVRDRPLAEVLDDIRAQTGFPIELAPEAGPAFRDRRITLRTAEPVVFWEALDRIGAAAGVRHDPGLPWDQRAPLVRLIAADGPPPPASYDGPFRVNLVALGLHRWVVPARPLAKSEVREEFGATLQVFAEPGLALNLNGPAVLLEAVDSRGRDLRPESMLPYQRSLWARQFDEVNPGVLQYRIPLVPPEDAGGRLARLRGYLPVTVVARTSGPLVVPLDDAAGRSFSGAGVTVSVIEVRDEKANTTIDIAVRDESWQDTPTPVAGVGFGMEPAPLGDFRPPFRLEDPIQVLNADGGVCAWWATDVRDGPGGTVEARLVVAKEPGGPPAELCYHHLVGAATEILFDVSDLPMP